VFWLSILPFGDLHHWCIGARGLLAVSDLPAGSLIIAKIA